MIKKAMKHSSRLLSISSLALSLFLICLSVFFGDTRTASSATVSFNPAETFNFSIAPLPTTLPSGNPTATGCSCPAGSIYCGLDAGISNDSPCFQDSSGAGYCGQGTQCVYVCGGSSPNASGTCCANVLPGGALDYSSCLPGGGALPAPGEPEPSCIGFGCGEPLPTFTRLPVNTQVISPRVSPTSTPTPSAPAALPPTLNLQIKPSALLGGPGPGGFSDGPVTINQGEAIELAWQTSNVTVCDASSGWNGSKDPRGGIESNTPATTNLQASKLYALTCYGPGGVVSDFVIANVISTQPTPTPTPSVVLTPTPTATPAVPPPQLNLTGRLLNSGSPFTDGPITILAGQRPELQWTAQNVTSCTASNGWTGNKAINGTEAQSPISTATVYTLTCTGPGGTVSDTFIAQVVVPTPTPALGSPFLDLKIRRLGSGEAFTDGPVFVNIGTPVELQWNSQNVSNCVATNAWSGSKQTTGTEPQSAVNTNSTYTLTCSGPSGSISDTVQAIIVQPNPTVIFVPPVFFPPTFNPPSTPFVDIKIRPFGSSLPFTDGPLSIQNGNGVELQWTSNNVSSCFATGGWNGVKAVNGTENAQNIQFPTSFTISCNGPGGTVSDSVTALVTDAQNPQLSVIKSGRNITSGTQLSSDLITARPGETLEFTLSVRNFGNTVARNVILNDTLPSGLQYIQSSTTRDGVPQSDLIISTLSIGDIQPGQTVNVTFRAIIAQSFAEGVSRVNNLARARLPDGRETSDTLLIEINKPFTQQTSPTTSASFIKTGRNVTRGDANLSPSVTARPGDRIEFLLTLRSSALTTNVTIKDYLPAQFTIIPGTIYLNNQPLTSSTLTSQGISIGTVNANQDYRLQFTAILADQQQLDSSITSLTNFAEARSNNVSIAPLAQLPIQITRGAAVSATPRPSLPPKGPATIPTGTSDALIYPLLLGILIIALYGVYTRTTWFKVRELEAEMRRESEDKDRFNMLDK